MAFGINRTELEGWKAKARAGEIAFLTHYWHDPRFPQATTVTKAACVDVSKLIEWGKTYGLNPQWIDNRNEFPHFDLLGEKQVAILAAEGKLDHLLRFHKQLYNIGGLMMKVNQDSIRRDLHTKADIDPKEEIRTRVDFLKNYTRKAGTKGFVLGISGGQDSTLAAKLAQMAVDELNQEAPGTYQFHAVRLPYGVQHDEEDAQVALSFISPDKIHTVNIKPAVDAAVASFVEATGEELSGFIKGNTKARERMKVQFDLAAHYQCLVLGTDHAAEAVTGFFTKFGDGACDVIPLYGLTKRQGKALLQELGAPEALYQKVPTADLEDDKPGLPDEEALGMTYEQIDDYLEGKPIDSAIQEKLEKRYAATAHKRKDPVSVYDRWWKG